MCTTRIVAFALSSLVPLLTLAAVPKAPPHRAPLHRVQRIQSPNPLPEKVAVTGLCFPAEVLGFSVAGFMKAPRDSHSATLLTDGRVLVAGGFDGHFTNTCEIYDPKSNSWGYTGSLTYARQWQTATLLRNGKVLVVGGGSGTDPLNSVELFDPATGSWTTMAAINVSRYWHTATLLPDGKVLVTGGATSTGSTASAELYDPVLNTWTPGPLMSVERAGHTATLLPNGTVLVAGGTAGDFSALDSAEIYTEGAGWTPVARPMIQGRFYHSATLLPNGTVLVAGGTADGEGSLASSEIFVSGIWAATTAPMDKIRCWHTASLLPNGMVLVTGGEGTGGTYGDALSSCELFDPALGIWAPADDMESSRTQHTAVILPSGQILIAGGYDGLGEVAAAELYDPGPATPYYNGGEPLWAATDPLTPTTICLGTDALLATGSNFQGLSECSGGGGNQNSSTNFPLLQITDSATKVTYIPVAPDAGWSTISLQSVVVDGAIAPGEASVKIVINGVPSEPLSIMINVPPAIESGSPADPPAICSGATATLTLSATGTGSHYQWYQGTAPDTTIAVGTDSSSYAAGTLSSTTSYWVRVTGTCGSPADSRTATVTVIPAPAPTISGASGNTCPSTGVDLSTQSGMTDYQWYVDASLIEGATSSSYTATVSGTYTVSYSNGCGAGTSAGHAVTITACLPPPETAPGDAYASAQKWTGKTTITWPVNSAATSGYHVYRGLKADLPNLLDSGSDSCTRATTTDASSVSASEISEDPSGVTGRFYWYLVTGLNWAEGTAGNATAGERILNRSGACP